MFSKNLNFLLIIYTFSFFFITINSSLLNEKENIIDNENQLIEEPICINNNDIFLRKTTTTCATTS